LSPLLKRTVVVVLMLFFDLLGFLGVFDITFFVKLLFVRLGDHPDFQTEVETLLQHVNDILLCYLVENGLELCCVGFPVEEEGPSVDFLANEVEVV
jgi:hypothetical protein